MKVIVSCQYCLSQYEADSGMHGKLGRCGECKAYFAISLAELATPGEAIAFGEPIEPRYSFLYEGAACIARHMKDIFELASEPYTPESAVRFVHSMPGCMSEAGNDWRSGYCNKLLRRAYAGCYRKSDFSRHRAAVDYFLWHFTAKRRDSRDMLIGAFAGVLSAEFDRVGELAVYRPWWRFWR